MQQIPIPTMGSFEGVVRTSIAYLAAASSKTAPAKLKRLLLHVDAEVLKLYSLPLDLEQRVLGLFNGTKRLGVPFNQTRYLPSELEAKIRFCDFLEADEDWPNTNRERGMLIDKNISGRLSEDERARLDALQAYTDYHIERVAPRPTGALNELEDRLFSGSRTKDQDVQ
jgi:hypothetical protein